MKKFILALLLVPFFVFAATATERLTSALSIVKELSNIPDAGAFIELLRQSEGIAIYPTLIKVGLVIGGQYGEGIVFKRDTVSGKWLGPLFVKLSGLSLGAQIGVQNVGLVLVLMNEDAVKSFTSSNVTLGGNVSVAAGPLGRSLSADTDYKLQASIYSYSVSKGFFAGLSLQGSVVQVDDEVNKQFYGSSVSASDILKAESKAKEVLDLVNYLNNLIYLQPST